VDSPPLQDPARRRAALLRLNRAEIAPKDANAMKNVIRIFFLLTIAVITAAILRSMI
jgi:hypothetical protein